jgi:hypothetical protein
MRRAVVLAAISCFFAFGGTGSAAHSAGRVHELYGWARQIKPFVGVSTAGLSYGAAVARHVAPGRYRLHVAARSDLAFHLVGPGIDRQTRFTLEPTAPIYSSWTISLKRGRYRYSAEGVYAKQLRAAGVRVSGSFAVP